MKPVTMFAFGLVLIGFVSSTLQAQTSRVDLSLGVASVSNDEYDDAEAAVISYSFTPGFVEFSVGLFGAKDFVLEDRISSINERAELDVRGGYLSVGHEFDFGAAFMEIHGGAAFTNTEARINNFEIGEDDTIGAMGNIAIGYKFNHFFGVKAGVLYLDDVSGENFTLLNIGTRWAF